MLDIPAENRELDALDQSQPKEPTKGLLLGTDFRHAVEFSRSGRAATRPSRASSLAACPTVRRLRSPAPGGCFSAALPGPSGARRTIHDPRGGCASRERASPITPGPVPGTALSWRRVGRTGGPLRE